MPNIPSFTRLADTCVHYKSDEDEVFGAEDIEQERLKEFPAILVAISDRLKAIASNARFEGWIALYKPHDIGPVLSREVAAPFRDQCDELIGDALRYAEEELEMQLCWKEASGQKLAYDITQPEQWKKLLVGAALQSLLSYQRHFVVEVIPKWEIDGRLCGLTDEQALQYGWYIEDAMRDVGGGFLLGDNPDDSGGYDLGIDEQFL